MESFLSKSSTKTLDFATSFASTLKRNDIVLMMGELGSGKTQFVKGVCRCFGVHDSISSPTFVMLHRYEGRDARNEELLLYHFDLYKVKNESEILELGYQEFFQSNGICLVEWGDKLSTLIPRRRIEINFTLGNNESERHLTINRIDDISLERSRNIRSIRTLQSEYPRN